MIIDKNMTEIYVENIDKTERIVDVIIPDWHPRKVISLPMLGFPIPQLDRSPDRKIYAQVNLNATDETELNITYFPRDFWNDK